MRSEVLGLIDDEELVGDGAASDVGEWFDLDDSHVFESLDGHMTTAVLAFFAVGGEEEVNTIVDGLHPGVEFFFDGSGEEADISAEGKDGAGDEHAVIGLLVGYFVKAAGNGNKGLSGSGFSNEGDQFDGVIEEQVHGEDLLFVSGSDAPDVAFSFGGADVEDVVFIATDTAEGGPVGVIWVGDGEELVGEVLSLEGELDATLFHEAFDFGGGQGSVCVPGVHLDGAHVALFVVIGSDTQGIGSDAEIGIHGNEHGFDRWLDLREVECHGKDFIILH